MAAPPAPIAPRDASPLSALASGARRAGQALGAPVGSVIFAFVVGALVVLVTHGNPLLAYQSLLCGGFGVACIGGENSVFQLSETVVFMTPLILTGLAVAISFRAGLFNIGAEGQLVMGAIASVWLGTHAPGVPAVILLPAVLLAGALAGSLFGGIVGLLKVTTGAHEVVTTIMLNYVALWLTRFLIVGGPLQSPGSFSRSVAISPAAQLPTLFGQGSNLLFGLPASVFRANAGIFVSLLAAVVFWFVLQRTAFGYELRAVGQSQRAARYAGVSVRRTIILTMLLSGAFAGLAGAVQMAGLYPHGLTDTFFTDTTGFDAIAVALLGLNTAVGTVLAAVLFGALHAGGSVMQSDASISGNLVFVLEALVLFSLAANFLRSFKIRLPALGRAPATPATEAATATAEEIDSENSPAVAGERDTTA